MAGKFIRQEAKVSDASFAVSVKTSDQKALLASINNAGLGFYWDEASTTVVPLLVEAPGATKDDCDRFSVDLRYYAQNNSTIFEWVRVTLYFSDGTTLLAQQLNVGVDPPTGTFEFSSP
jgi:hypothetical protein